MIHDPYVYTKIKMIHQLILCFSFVFLNVFAAEEAIEVNYDVDGWIKYLHVNQTLEITCKSLLHGHPVSSWVYPASLYDDPRMNIYFDEIESRLVINNTKATDAGQYTCGFFYASNGTYVRLNKTIEVIAVEAAIEVNYDIGHYKLLQVNHTLELICKNKLNRDLPAWTYHSRLYNDPRMIFYTDVGESRLVISNAQVEDAGKYECSIDHEFNGRTFHFNKTIEVIVNKIKEVKVEEKKDYIKLLCDVHAYPSPTVIWKIDYDNQELNPQPEEPDLDDDNWVPPEEKVVVDKSGGRWTLRPYKGINNAELIIANVTENDNGNYSCVARNVAGEVCKSCNIRRFRRVGR